MCPEYVDWFIYDDIEKFEEVCLTLIKNKYRKMINIGSNEKDNIIESLL